MCACVCAKCEREMYVVDGEHIFVELTHPFLPDLTKCPFHRLSVACLCHMPHSVYVCVYTCVVYTSGSVGSCMHRQGWRSIW